MSDHQNKNKRGDLSSWIFPIFMLIVFTPLGVLLIVLKLLDGNKRGGVRGRHPYYVQRDNQGSLGARTTVGPAPAQHGEEPSAKGRKKGTPQQDFISELAGKGKKLSLVGGILTAVFTVATLSGLGNASYWLISGEVCFFLQELLDLVPLLCFVGGGLGCLWAGVRKRKQAQRYRNYLAMIGRRQSVTISSLSCATNLPAGRVREDLENMLNEGLFPAGFLDYGGDMLILSGEGLRDDSSRVEKAAQEKSNHSEENAVLSEIKAVNDAIANEKLSDQIDHIGIITAKILEYQKGRPEKAPQLHSFLSYYLPTTLKILRAYGQLESQEISGENITAAMARIEGMMDKVVEGFEKQLDQLFQGDVMDITTDVEVLERMLAKDGLSSDQGLTLGL